MKRKAIKEFERLAIKYDNNMAMRMTFIIYELQNEMTFSKKRIILIGNRYNFVI